MSIRSYRSLAASALLVGALGLPARISAATTASPAVRPARPAVAAAGPAAFASVLDAAWTRLFHLFAADHGAGSSSHHGHSGGDPDTDEGPGMCPHGH
jgi:hypothetical protein